MNDKGGRGDRCRVCVDGSFRARVSIVSSAHIPAIAADSERAGIYYTPAPYIIHAA